MLWKSYTTTWFAITLALTITLDSQVLAQSSDSTALAEVYDAFARTVRDVDGAGHLALYVHPLAPVHIIVEDPSGPTETAARNATEWVAQFTRNRPNLNIFNIEFEQQDGVAASIADYNSGGSTGLDLFGYVKTTAGWRLLLLHATGDPITGARTISNSIADVLSALNTTVTAANKSTFLDLFARTSSPFLSFESDLKDPFAFDTHSVEAYIGSVDSAGSSIAIELSNVDIRVEDAYTARVWADYRITRDNQGETGRALIFMFATGSRGWRVSAFAGAQQQITSVKTAGPLPGTIALQQNYPNPFNPTTTISYDLIAAGHVKVSVYNVLGQNIKTLVDKNQNSGSHRLAWDGTNSSGLRVTSGSYYYEVKAGGKSVVKSMILLK